MADIASNLPSNTYSTDSFAMRGVPATSASIDVVHLQSECNKSLSSAAHARPLGTAVSCSYTLAPLGAAVGCALLTGRIASPMLESSARTSLEPIASVFSTRGTAWWVPLRPGSKSLGDEKGPRMCKQRKTETKHSNVSVCGCCCLVGFAT